MARNENRACHICGGTGIIVGAIFQDEGLGSARVVERCDTCKVYEGDLEAAAAYAKEVSGIHRAIVTSR